MKRFFLLLFTVFIFSQIALAQSYGVVGGLNLTNVYSTVGDDVTSEDFISNKGFFIGALAEYSPSEMFGVRSGILFETKGYNYDYDLVLWEGNLKTKLNYLTVPVYAMPQYYINDDLKVYGLIGPAFSLGLSGKSINETDNDKEESILSLGNDEEEDDFKSFDMGLVFGGGINIQGVNILISYNLGLSNIAFEGTLEQTAKNRALSIGIGYMISQ
jgi:hypothetical protein